MVKNKNHFDKSFRNFRTKHSEKKRFSISRVARALFSSPFSTALARKKRQRRQMRWCCRPH